MTKRYGDDNWQELLRTPTTDNGLPQALPRVSRYGGRLAEYFGLVPMSDFPDQVVEVADFKEIITFCRTQQVFPEFHQKASWMPDGQRWNQDGLPYCWCWGMAATVMDCRAVEGKDRVMLAPNSLGWLVNWANQGYYLDATIDGARDRGIAPASFVPDFLSRNPKTFKQGWEDQALLYRPSEWWDTKKTTDLEMTRQCLSILATGRSLYIAFDWWGHALSCCGMKWDESEKNGIVWVIRNSHNEDTTIELTGSKGVPDEAYGVRATVLAD